MAVNWDRVKWNSGNDFNSDIESNRWDPALKLRTKGHFYWARKWEGRVAVVGVGCKQKHRTYTRHVDKNYGIQRQVINGGDLCIECIRDSATKTKKPHNWWKSVRRYGLADVCTYHKYIIYISFSQSIRSKPPPTPFLRPTITSHPFSIAIS